MVRDLLNSESPDCRVLTSDCRCSREECIANEKAALALINGVGGDMDGSGNRVTVASRTPVE